MEDDATHDARYQYPRVLLKISGESLMGSQSYGIDPEMVATVAREVRDVVASGLKPASSLVVAISSAGYQVPPLAWNVPLAIIWACWRR